MAGDISLTYFSCMDFSADCTILTAMISRVQSYEKLQKSFPAVLCHLEDDTLMYSAIYMMANATYEFMRANATEEMRRVLGAKAANVQLAVPPTLAAGDWSVDSEGDGEGSSGDLHDGVSESDNNN